MAMARAVKVALLLLPAMREARLPLMPVSKLLMVPVLAAVGPLQFGVVQFRLESEYNAVSRLEPAPWQGGGPQMP